MGSVPDLSDKVYISGLSGKDCILPHLAGQGLRGHIVVGLFTEWWT